MMTWEASVTVKRPIPDDVIAKGIEQQLIWDVHVDASRVAVEVCGGVVRLRGSVQTPKARQAAEAVLWGIGGVSEVENHLTADPHQERPTLKKRSAPKR